MCNIAGYIGDKNAAPVLLEMLKRQEIFDGGLSTGIATVHEGKLYMAKIVGDVEKLIRETDALRLPGKIGIAHSRPTADFYEFAQPCMAQDGKTVCAQNGTSRDVVELAEKRNEIVTQLYNEGYSLSSRLREGNKKYPMIMQTGERVASADAGACLVVKYRDEGLEYPQAIAKMSSDFYSDKVSTVLTANAPDNIFVTRITRPMEIMVGKGETYIATTRFAFPDSNEGYAVESLPIMQSCTVFKGGYTVTPYRVEEEAVCEITPSVYAKCYTRLCEALEKDELCFDDAENMIYFNWSDIWEEKHTLNQCGKLAYDILYSLKKEGKLCGRLREQGGRRLYYMHKMIV